jgi:hypothetical protein
VGFARSLVALAAIAAGCAFAGCGSLVEAGCSSPSGPGPRREADAYIRDLVRGGRKAAAGDFASFAQPIYEDLPEPVPGQDVKRVLASAKRGSKINCAGVEGFGVFGPIDPCFWYALRTEDDHDRPPEFGVVVSCDGGRWRIAGGPGRDP